MSKKGADRKRSGKKRPRPGDLSADEPTGVASGEKTGCILRQGHIHSHIGPCETLQASRLDATPTSRRSLGPIFEETELDCEAPAPKKGV